MSEQRVLVSRVLHGKRDQEAVRDAKAGSREGCHHERKIDGFAAGRLGQPTKTDANNRENPKRNERIRKWLGVRDGIRN